MGLVQEISALINSNVDAAISLITTRYPLSRSAAACTMFTKVRKYYLDDQANRHPEFDESIWTINPSDRDPDQHKWQKFMRASLYQQYQTWKIKKQFFSDPDYEKAFRNIKLVKDQFFLFVLPREYHEAKYTTYANRLKLKHEDPSTRANEVYSFTKEELEEIHRVVLEVLNRYDAIKDSIDYYNTLACLLLCSGRRYIEIMSLLKVVREHSKHVIEVIGIAKRDRIRGGAETLFMIPLLVPCDVFIRRLKHLRDYRKSGDTHGKNRAMKRLFGRVLDHSTYRNLYAEICYSKRLQLDYYPSISKQSFISKVLCHEFQLTTSSSYQFIDDVPANLNIIGLHDTPELQDIST